MCHAASHMEVTRMHTEEMELQQLKSRSREITAHRTSMCHVCQLVLFKHTLYFYPDVMDSSSKYNTRGIYIRCDVCTVRVCYVSDSAFKILRMRILEISTLVVEQLPSSFQCNLSSGSFFCQVILAIHPIVPKL